MAGRSGFGRLRSPHVPGSSHAIGVCAPFTVWAVVPLLAGNHNKHYKNNRDPTCWLGPLTILDFIQPTEQFVLDDGSLIIACHGKGVTVIVPLHSPMLTLP